jgi:hypothetical protein
MMAQYPLRTIAGPNTWLSMRTQAMTMMYSRTGELQLQR